MSRVRYDRVRAMVILLENIPREQRLGRLPKARFDMRYWHGTDIFECDTAACALGLAASHTVFQRHGLQLQTTYSADARPNFRNYYGYMAGAAFFGVGLRTSREWFDPVFYLNVAPRSVTPEHVADRIRAWLVERDELGMLAVAA